MEFSISVCIDPESPCPGPPEGMFLPRFTPRWVPQRVSGVIPTLLIDVSHRKYMELDHSLHTSSSKQIEAQHSDDFFRLHHAIFN